MTFDLACEEAKVSPKERDDLVAAAAAVDVNGLSKKKAREAKELVVGKLPGAKGLSGGALSDLFHAAGCANGSQCSFFFSFFFTSPRVPKAPARFCSLLLTRGAPFCCTSCLERCLRPGLGEGGG